MDIAATCLFVWEKTNGADKFTISRFFLRDRHAANWITLYLMTNSGLGAQDGELEQAR